MKTSFKPGSVISGLALGENGRIDLATGSPDLYLAGLPFDSKADVTPSEQGGSTHVYVGGQAITLDGLLRFLDIKTSPLPVDTVYIDGLPHSQDGVLFVDSVSPISAYAHGVPITQNGAVAVEALIESALRLLTEDGTPILTEDGRYLLINVSARLTTASGDRLTTNDGLYLTAN